MSRTVTIKLRICGGDILAGTELHVAFDQMSPYTVNRLADATVDLVKRFLQQPGGRELLEAKKAELRKQGLL